MYLLSSTTGQVDLVSVDPRDRTPIYVQLERGLRAAIAAGRLQPGDRLPTVRQLAVDLRVNANTVARVYGDLERRGVLETRRGVGTPSFVSATPAQARPPREHHRRLHAFVTRLLARCRLGRFHPVDEVTSRRFAHVSREDHDGPHYLGRRRPRCGERPESRPAAAIRGGSGVDINTGRVVSVRSRRASQSCWRMVTRDSVVGMGDHGASPAPPVPRPW